MTVIYVSADKAKSGADPAWGHAGQVHDWRNHVPEYVRAIWDTFSAAQLAAIVEWADELASAEEWE